MLWSCREGGVEWGVSAALAAGGVRPGNVGLHVGRHYSVRDLITWCNRMQVSALQVIIISTHHDLLSAMYSDQLCGLMTAASFVHCLASPSCTNGACFGNSWGTVNSAQGQVCVHADYPKHKSLYSARMWFQLC